MASGMPSKSLPLTFGVELEFAIKRAADKKQTGSARQNPYDNVMQPIFADDAARRAVVDRLRSPNVGLRARMAYNTAAIDHPSPVDMYDAWQVDNDRSIKFGPEDAAAAAAGTDVKHVPIELISPVFKATTDTGAPNAAAEAELRRALFAVTTHFDAAVNDSCNLHVHVGSVRADGRRGFAPATLAALAVLVTCCERPLSMLLPQARQLSNRYCTPPSQVPSLYMSAPLERLSVLWRQPSVRGLRLYFNDGRGRYSAYNYSHLADYAPPATDTHTDDTGAKNSASSSADDNDDYDEANEKLQTVEFRQFPGCLDADTVVAWTRVVCRLVEFAHAFSHHTSPMPMLEEALRYVPPDRPASAHDILCAIGLEDSLRYLPLYPASLPNNKDVLPHVVAAIAARKDTAG